MSRDAAGRNRVTRVLDDGTRKNVWAEEVRAEADGVVLTLAGSEMFVCSGGTDRDGNPCLSTVAVSGSVCDMCNREAKDVFGNELGRGGFPRNYRGGAQVTPPNWKTGMPKPTMWTYKSASSIVVSTSNENLAIWQQRQILRALARDPELSARFNAAMDEVDPDDEKAEKKVLDQFRNEAHEIAQSQRGAQQGTFTHWLTECQDQGVSPIDGLAKGEPLGFDQRIAGVIMDDWNEINERHGFRSAAVEAKIVNDELRAAGTTDRVISLEKPLTFTHKGTEVTLPVGTNLIGDLKTGGLRLDRAGSPNYWQKYAGQLATYAGGEPYDPVTGERTGWDDLGGRPSQKWGVIIHGDLERMAEGHRDGFTVFVVDLEEGRALANASNEMRRAEYSANSAMSRV